MNQQQMEQARRAQATQSGTPLTSKELAEVVQEASRRHGEAIKNDDAGRDLASVNDAYAVAEELGIPVEHVRAALAARAERKAEALIPVLGLVGFGVALVTGITFPLLGLPLFVGVLAGVVVGGALFVAGLIYRAMKRNPQKQAGPSPVPGTCRVCFQPAHAPESTFCEEHRYKSPGGGKP